MTSESVSLLLLCSALECKRTGLGIAMGIRTLKEPPLVSLFETLRPL